MNPNRYLYAAIWSATLVLLMFVWMASGWYPGK